MGKWLKKRDIILIVSLLVVGIIALVIWHFIYSVDGKYVTIEQRDNLIGIYPLNVDKEIEIEHRGEVVNKIVIEDGYCHMEEAECPDHLCIKQGKVNKSGQTIVCLPDRVVVTVVDSDSSDYDSVVN